MTTTRLSAQDTNAMRHALRVTATQTDSTAVLSCQLPLARPIPLLSRVTVPLAAHLGASPPRGGDPLALEIRHARRNPTWVALVNTVRVDDQLEIRWERNGYALLLVLSDGGVVDQFSFPTTRRTRRMLSPRPSQPGRAARALAALADIAGRIPVPGRNEAAPSEAAALQPANGPAGDPVSSTVGNDG